MMEMSTQQKLDDILSSMRVDEPQFIVCGPVPYSMFQAMNKYAGRDWRRIKREVRKAAKRARDKQRASLANERDIG